MNKTSLFLSMVILCCLFSACSDEEGEIMEPERLNEWKFIKGKINGEPLTIGFEDILSLKNESGVIDADGVRTADRAFWATRGWIDKEKSIALTFGFTFPLSEGDYTVNYTKEDASSDNPASPTVSIAIGRNGIYYPSEIPAELRIDRVYYKDWSELPFIVGRLEGKFINCDNPTDVIYLKDIEFQIH